MGMNGQCETSGTSRTGQTMLTFDVPLQRDSTLSISSELHLLGHSIDLEI
jgi:hypothetical protein